VLSCESVYSPHMSFDFQGRRVHDYNFLRSAARGWPRAISRRISLTVTDYYERGGTRWLRFQEKRGKELPLS
jgi:hypothetical protein